MTTRTGIAAVLAALALAAIAAIAAPAATAATSPVYVCDPPLPRAAANCAIWHNSPVTLRWAWDSLNEDPDPGVAGSDCSSPHVFSADTAGTNVLCAVKDSSGGTATATATIRIDATPPVVTGFTADRPPDYNGWYTHPVTLTFDGKDALSGIQSCDVVNYAGPDSDGMPVSGTCRDVAGNAAVGAFPFNYDATPPSIAALPAKLVRGRNIINWTTSPDAVETRILRSPGIGNAPVSEVYVGSGHTFSDHAVKGGKRYTYSLTAPDAAGNTASTTIVVTAKPGPEAAAATIVTGLPRLRWTSVGGASYYNIQLYRGGRKILSAWPRGSSLQIHRRWAFNGRNYVLTPAVYDWYAWPGYGSRAQRRYGHLIVHRSFKVIPKKFVPKRAT